MTGWQVAPVLVVRDVAASLAHYRDQPGFEVVGTFGEPLETAFVGRGDVQIMLQDAEGKPTPGPDCSYESVAWDALFWVEDAKARGRCRGCPVDPGGLGHAVPRWTRPLAPSSFGPRCVTPVVLSRAGAPTAHGAVVRFGPASR